MIKPTESLRYQIGEWVYDARTLTITCSEKQLTLERGVAHLLDYFIANPKRVISKEELVTNVWKSVVTDNAVSSAITRLRTCLGDNPRTPEYIATLSRVGYRLIANVVEINDRHDNMALYSRSAVLVMVSLALSMLWYFGFRPEAPSIKPPLKLKPLTGFVGDEIHPSLSPDGSLLAFSHRKAQSENWSIWVRQLDTTAQIKISTNEMNAKLPKWDAHGRRLLFRSVTGDVCEYYFAEIENMSLVRLIPILGCVTGSDEGNIIWSADPNAVYFTQASSKSEPFIIYRYHLLTKKLSQITSPPDTGRGDYRVEISPDLKTLGFLRDSVHLNQTDVWIYDLRSAESRLVATVPATLRGLAWSEDSNHIIVADKNQQLQSINKDDSNTKTLTFGLTPLFHPASGGGKIAAAAGSYHRREVWRAVGDFSTSPPVLYSLEPFIVSSRSNRLPQLNPVDNSVAYISEESGSQQIWLQLSNGDSHQITELDTAHYFRALNWSPDGKKLVAAANNKLLWIDTNTRTTITSGEMLENVSDPKWASDNRHIYVGRKQSADWQIFKIDPTTNTHEIVTRNGGYKATTSATNDDSLYISKLHQGGLWKLDLTNGQEMRLDSIQADLILTLGWAVRGPKPHLFYIHPENTQSIKRLSLGHHSEQPVDMIQLEQDWIIDFDISMDESTILFSRSVPNNTDIILLTSKDE